MTHEPVLLQEVMGFLAPLSERKDGVRVLDGTLGLGGYSESILEALPGVRVLGLDRDLSAISHSEQRLGRFVPRFRAVHGRFGAMGTLLRDEAPFDALVFDLGVSNMQLTEAERGFSFQHDGPLDMRMDPHGGAPTAAEVLMRKGAGELARIFWEYGGERYSRQIAARVEAERRRGRRIETTGQFVALIRELLPAPVQRKMGIHPARRVFQALRIYVNDELGELESMLSALPGLAAKGAVAVIVSYHSLEDRIVKHRFRAWEKEEGRGRVLTRHPIQPGEEETERNFKARSAKLRAFSFS